MVNIVSGFALWIIIMTIPGTFLFYQSVITKWYTISIPIIIYAFLTEISYQSFVDNNDCFEITIFRNKDLHINHN